MPVTFENDNAIIVYALECVIAYARRTQQIFVAQCVWWLASIIGLEWELVSHIDKFHGERDPPPQEQLPWEVSATHRDLAEDQRIDQVLDNTDQYLRESRRLREITALKVSRETITGRINPTRKSKKFQRQSKRVSKAAAIKEQKNYSKTDGIDDCEISRRNAAGERLRCAWPFDKKGSHQVKDCIRGIELDKGTATFPEKRNHRKSIEENISTDSSDSEDNIDYDLWPYTPWST